jgi:hypothetical protein
VDLRKARAKASYSKYKMNVHKCALACPKYIENCQAGIFV